MKDQEYILIDHLKDTFGEVLIHEGRWVYASTHNKGFKVTSQFGDEYYISKEKAEKILKPRNPLSIVEQATQKLEKAGLDFKTMGPCPRCNGTGMYMSYGKCYLCNGTSKTSRLSATMHMLKMKERAQMGLGPSGR